MAFDLKKLSDTELESAFVNAKKGIKKLTGVKLTVAQAKERQALLLTCKDAGAEFEARFKKYQAEGRGHTLGEHVEQQINSGELTEE